MISQLHISHLYLYQLYLSQRKMQKCRFHPTPATCNLPPHLQAFAGGHCENLEKQRYCTSSNCHCCFVLQMPSPALLSLAAIFNYNESGHKFCPTPSRKSKSWFSPKSSINLWGGGAFHDSVPPSVALCLSQARHPISGPESHGPDLEGQPGLEGEELVISAALQRCRAHSQAVAGLDPQEPEPGPQR